MLRRRVASFLRSTFPHLKTRCMLLHGETILHTKEVKTAMREEELAIVPRWPAHSPDPNPQKSVWVWAEIELRRQ